MRIVATGFGESVIAVGYRFVSHVPSSVSFYAVEVYGFFEAAEGGKRFLNAAKSFVISEADSCEPSVTC